MTRNPCHGWANGDPVSCVKSDGSLIAVGKVSIFKSKAGRWTCMVRLETAGTGMGRYGESVWPEGWVWGQGKYRARCLDCGQTYLTNDPDEAVTEFCPPCERRDAKARADSRPTIRNLTGYLIGSRDPQPDRRPQTEEELAAIAAQQQKDRDESPY